MECRGAPRDLGRDQGEQFLSYVREALADQGLSVRRSRWPSFRALASGRVLGRGVGREIIRHYPHQGERLAGIAPGARVSLEALVDQCARASEFRDEAPGVSAALGASGGEAWLARLLPAPAFAFDTPIVRRTLPEVGFASLEVTRPWFVSCLAGVNEEGLAVAVSVSPPANGVGGFLTASLLAQDCLQRFTRVEACIDWCRKRPAESGACLLAADATGEIAKIRPGSTADPVGRPSEGLLAAGLSPEDEVALRKHVANHPSSSGEWHPESLCAALRPTREPPAGPVPGWRVQLFPGPRRLELYAGDETKPRVAFDAVRGG